MISVFLLFASFQFLHAFIDNTNKFCVLRASTEDVDQLRVLHDLHINMHKHQLDFWMSPTAVGHKADIMVPEDKLDWLETSLQNNNISFVKTIDDVEKLIVEREHRAKRPSFGKRLNNEGGNRARYAFGEYHSYDTIVAWMREVEQKYPDRAKVFASGTTHEGRQIFGIKIGKDIDRTDKRVFWIDGGIHAREWAAVHTVLYTIDRLIADYDDDVLVRNAIDRIHFYIIPVLNPDGYEYSRSDISPMIRLWRKNRSGVICKKDRWFRDRCCGGVDLNRNFDWFFGETGSSDDKCSEIYQGASAFSEAESRAVRDMVMSPALRGKVDGFITIHTYSQMWIHPYSHQRKTVPEDIREIENVGRAAVAALQSTYGTNYRFGTGADILYPSSGGSDDWAKGKGGAKFVYLLELRPGEEVWDGFILDQRQLIPTAKETWNGIRVVLSAVVDRLPRESVSHVLASSTSSTSSTTSSTSSTTTTASPPPTTLPPTTPLTQLSTLPWPTTYASAEPSTLGSNVFDAYYKLGKRTFKFASIRTFLPTTPSPIRTPSDTVLPAPFAVASTESFFSSEDIEGRVVTSSTVARRLGPQDRMANRRTNETVQRLRQQQNLLRGRNFRIRGETNSRPNAQRIPQEACIDKSPWCQAWRTANPNVCSVSSVYMRRDCARTCSFCRPSV